MRLFDSIVSLLAPHECLGCFAEGRLLCDDCRATLAAADKRCYKCLKPFGNFATCAACRLSAPLASVQSATRYIGLAKDIIIRMKFGRAQAAAAEIADILADRLGLDRHMMAHGDIIICHSPTATSRVRERGYDQSRLIAIALSKRSGIPYRALLARSGQKRQMHSSKQERRSQLNMAYHATSSKRLRGAHVLLVDDVSTTGSTLEAAATALRKAGAARVDGIVFAKA